MSTAFVISAVSAVLQHFLANALSDVSAIFGTVALSSKAPDLVQQEIGSGSQPAEPGQSLSAPGHP